MGNLFKKETKNPGGGGNRPPTNNPDPQTPDVRPNPTKQNSKTYKFTIFNIGDLGVGKTSLALKFLGEEFHDNVVPDYTIFDKKTKSLDVGSSKCVLSFLDTCGQERFKTITTTPYQQAHIVFVCFDISSRETFDNTATWFTEARYNNTDALLVLVGMKVDLLADRQVTADEATALCKQKQSFYVETSAKTGHHVEYLLQRSCEELIKLIDDGVIEFGEGSE